MYGQILEEITKRNSNLWIDVHRGSSNPGEEKVYTVYEGLDTRFLERINLVPGITVSNGNNIPAEHRAGTFYPRSLIDAFFPEEDFKNKTGFYSAALERTLNFINLIHEYSVRFA